MNNSNNRPLGWTTLEEAQQLVEAGLPVETADMRYSFIGVHIKEATENDYLLHTGSVDKDSYTFKHKFLVPCWSLGALIKLMPKTISVPVDEKSAYFYDLEWQFANDNSLRYIATNRGKCLIDIYSDHDIGNKSSIETCIEMVIWLLKTNYYGRQSI